MWFILLACAGSGPSTSSTGSTSDAPADGSQDTAPPLADHAPETAPGADDPDASCPAMYHQDVLADFRLEMDADQWAAIQSDYASHTSQFRPAAFTWVTPAGDAWAFEEAAVRLRGNPGFSWIGDKMQFLIAFDEWDDDGRLLGQRRLALDASWYNPSLLRDRLGYSMMRRLGVPAPCANHATLTVNGEYYGLFTNVEPIDHEFLERNYGDAGATGGLWEGGNDIDANAENADPAAVSAYWADPRISTQVATSDMPANLLEWAAEAVVPQADGYWCCSHNFYLYEHPEAGMTFLPWDLDYTFNSAPWFASPFTYYRDSNYQPHIDAVIADPVWGPAWHDALDDARLAYDPALMTTQIQDWSAQIADAMERDPHTTISPGAHRDAVARLAAFVDARRGYLDGHLACAQGDDSDHDGDGWTACADCDDGDPSIHPDATETCNRRDDDCDLWTDEAAGCDVCDEVSFEDGRFLLCREPLSWADADARCAAEGGTLGTPTTTGEWYLIVYSTYWQDEAWAGVYEWWAGPQSAGSCTALRPQSWATTTLDCAAERPAICRL